MRAGQAGRRAGPAGRRAALALLVAGALMASACGGDDDDSDGGSDSGGGLSSGEPTGPGSTTGPDQAPLADIDLTLTEVASADSPTAIVTRPTTDALYVVERPGTIREMAVSGSGADREYSVADEPLLDISDDVVTDVERGLLDAEFSPDGSVLFVHYSLAPDGNTQIDAYDMSGDGVDTSSRREILSVEQPYANHNGGEIEFGPDGYLYIGLGDGGDAGDPEGNGQDTEALLGKILRIDPLNASGGDAYAIPSDNPFADGSGGAPEVWLYGVRNPWRFSFDPETDDLWIGDVGQNEWEEIDLLPAADGGGNGANLGWNGMEATHEFEGGDEPDGAVAPVYEYSHDDGACSVTGGVVYRGTAIPGLGGAYLFADYCQGVLRAIRVADGGVADERVFDDASAGEIVSFGEDAAHDVYVVSLDGTISRIDAAS
jgi:glucose/arabinose dehydrogenase